LFIPLSAYPKSRTAFHEEREDDEDIYKNYGESSCLSWKEILSDTDQRDPNGVWPNLSRRSIKSERYKREFNLK
jgi:hypothetical protein